MGEEIGKTAFESGDFERFSERLRRETEAARNLFSGGSMSKSGYSLGFEIETWLLDHNYSPSPINETFLKTIDHPLVVPELSRFNVELNCTPAPLEEGVFSRMAGELTDLWAKCERVAHDLDSNLVMIGTLPVIRDADLSLDNLSPLKRYYALNHEVLRRRDGRAIKVEIEGRESLVSQHSDCMLEAATTSFQIHLKVPAAEAHLTWNASAMASGPVLAAATNAPFLFGRDLWDETRIPLFEQAVDLPGARQGAERVGFGRGYLKSSLFELFAENESDFPVLLPLDFDEPVEALRHLRLHNGTIWRWNRPLIGLEDAEPHLRIEHRPLPAGPTFADMMANAALYVGLVHALVMDGKAAAPALPFAEAKANFYAGARLGLEAEMSWPGFGKGPASRLLLDHLIPMARRGLLALGVAGDGGQFLDIIEQRVRTGQTGAAWQRKSLAANRGDFREMMAAYCERQRSGAPVHQWGL